MAALRRLTVALLDEIRAACARVASQAAAVTIDEEALARHARGLPLGVPGPGPDPEAHVLHGPEESRAAFFLCLDAINFGSGWWPTIRKRPGRSGYFTMAIGLRERFERDGAWAPEDLARIEPVEIARVLGQDPEHELMALYAASLRDLGARVAERGRWLAVVEEAGGSAEALVEELSGWDCFRDVSEHAGEAVPFFKRAQAAAADLAAGGVARFGDLHRLTMFADNLVPHVLRVDGVLRYADGLAARIDREELLSHGSPEEVEIRACGLHAVELIVAGHGPPATAAGVDHLLWNRGQEPRYKARPRHRARTTAY